MCICICTYMCYTCIYILGKSSTLLGWSAPPSCSHVGKSSAGGGRDVIAEGIDLSYGGTVLLESASLRVAYGRRYGVVGWNGVGKSTLMRSILHRDLPVPESLSVVYVDQIVACSDLRYAYYSRSLLFLNRSISRSLLTLLHASRASALSSRCWQATRNLQRSRRRKRDLPPTLRSCR